MKTKQSVPNTPKLAEWEKEFDKWFNHGTNNEPRFAYASGVYGEVKDFISQELAKQRNYQSKGVVDETC